MNIHYRMDYITLGKCVLVCKNKILKSTDDSENTYVFHNSLCITLCYAIFLSHSKFIMLHYSIYSTFIIKSICHLVES